MSRRILVYVRDLGLHYLNYFTGSENEFEVWDEHGPGGHVWPPDVEIRPLSHPAVSDEQIASEIGSSAHAVVLVAPKSQFSESEAQLRARALGATAVLMDPPEDPAFVVFTTRLAATPPLPGIRVAFANAGAETLGLRAAVRASEGLREVPARAWDTQADVVVLDTAEFDVPRHDLPTAVGMRLRLFDARPLLLVDPSYALPGAEYSYLRRPFTVSDFTSAVHVVGRGGTVRDTRSTTTGGREREPARETIRINAEVRAECVEALNRVRQTLVYEEMTGLEGLVAELIALPAVERAIAALSLEPDAVADALTTDQQEMLVEQASVLGRVADVFRYAPGLNAAAELLDRALDAISKVLPI